ncbi:MAG: hypothetical protein ABW198_13840 [Pseudorhodoplanes sp.]
MVAHRFLVAAALASVSLPALAQNVQNITVLHAVANNGADPAGAKEIALKDHFSARCDGRASCTQSAAEIVPANNFVIEITFACRDSTGASRQIGPKQYGAGDIVELNCR